MSEPLARPRGCRSLADRSSSAAELIAPHDDDDDVAGVSLGLAVPLDDDTGDLAGPKAWFPAASTRRSVSSVTFGCASAGSTQTTWASDLAWSRHGNPSHVSHRMQGLGGGVLLVEHDAQRHVKRPQPGACEVVVQLLDARLVADRRDAVRSRSRTVPSGPHRAAPCTWYRLFRLACSTARARRSRSATPARRRRRAAARRSPRGAAGTARRRRISCCRRRSSSCADAVAGRPYPATTPSCGTSPSTFTACEPQLSFSRRT